MIICPNSDERIAYNVAQTIRRKIQMCQFPRVNKITISGGVSDIYTSKDTDSMIHGADEALYRAKKSGRNRVQGVHID